GMVALLYVMAHDGELPEPFLQLNRFGVPWVALITATILPVVVLDIDDSVEGLASLYAIGVVGAIAINLGSCAFANRVCLRAHERIVMKATFFVLAAIWLTIAWSKRPALLFVTIVLGAGLAIRELTRRHRLTVRAAAASLPSRQSVPAPSST